MEQLSSKSPTPPQPDVTIIGAGIAGLWTARRILKKHPNLRVLILEKYDYAGGRIVTYHNTIPNIGKIQWEIGAGRISTRHHHILNLMKEYNLTFNQLSPDSLIQSSNSPILTPNPFSKLLEVYLLPLCKLHPTVLAEHTLYELLSEIHTRDAVTYFLSTFPYSAEMHHLRADLALKTFTAEMSSDENFGTCKEGLSAITDNMVRELKALGAEIIFNTEVVNITQYSLNRVAIHLKEDHPHYPIIVTKNVVCALHSNALKKFPSFSKINTHILNNLTMQPLIRMYAVFPKNKETSKVWFENSPRIISEDNPLRYIIPIDYEKGIIMISYTDSEDCKFWLKIKEEKKTTDHIQKEVMKQIRYMFPNVEIPDPIFFRYHPWTDGCTYWKPGKYSPEELSIRILNPLPNVFVCGESYSTNQCWMEGAIEHAEMLWNNHEFQKQLSK